MARRPYVHLAGDLSGWPKGLVPTPALLRRLDQFSSELVNGEDGGTWAPTDPIVLGFYRSPTLFLSTAGSVLSGDVVTVRGNADASERDRPGLVLVDGAVPVLQSSRTRSIVVPLAPFMERGGAVTDDRGFLLDPATMGAKQKNLNLPWFTVPLPLRAQHAGATIASVDFRYRIANQRSALPVYMPTFRVVKCTAGALAPLHTVAAPYDANGSLPDQAATAADYYDNGNVRTTTYTPNQNNTALDPTTAYWAVEVIGEGGANAMAGDIYLSATVHLTSIADMRQE
jgi:hypothetical protein